MNKTLPPSCQRTNDLNVARARLSRFVHSKALEVVRRTGVNYEESAEAPQTFPEILAEWSRAVNKGLPFRVYSGGSDKSIYDFAAVNWAFRFWHDFLHVAHNADLSHSSEVFVGQLQVVEVAHEFGRGSLEAKLMFADTVAQAVYFNVYGEFVDDQLAFAKHVISSQGAVLSLLPPKGKPAFDFALSATERHLLAA